MDQTYSDYDYDDHPEETREQLESRYEEIMKKMAAYGIDVDDLLDHLDEDEEVDQSHEFDTTKRKSVFLQKLADFAEVEPDPYDDWMLDAGYEVDVSGVHDSTQYTETADHHLSQEFSDLFLETARADWQQPAPEPPVETPVEDPQPEQPRSGDPLLEEIKARGIRREESQMIRQMSDDAIFDAVFGDTNPKPKPTNNAPGLNTKRKLQYRYSHMLFDLIDKDQEFEAALYPPTPQEAAAAASVGHPQLQRAPSSRALQRQASRTRLRVSNRGGPLAKPGEEALRSAATKSSGPPKPIGYQQSPSSGPPPTTSLPITPGLNTTDFSHTKSRSRAGPPPPVKPFRSEPAPGTPPFPSNTKSLPQPVSPRSYNSMPGAPSVPSTPPEQPRSSHALPLRSGGWNEDGTPKSPNVDRARAAQRPSSPDRPRSRTPEPPSKAVSRNTLPRRPGAAPPLERFSRASGFSTSPNHDTGSGPGSGSVTPQRPSGNKPSSFGDLDIVFDTAESPAFALPEGFHTATPPPLSSQDPVLPPPSDLDIGFATHNAIQNLQSNPPPQQPLPPNPQPPQHRTNEPQTHTTVTHTTQTVHVTCLKPMIRPAPEKK